jgi:Signal transduction histidine kinase
LRNETDQAERDRVAGRIDLAVGNMNELFNALLDISRLDAGALNATLSDFPVSNILRHIETTFAATAREKGLVLRVVPSSAWIRSDAILLERVLLNLVSNAIRYTPKGGIVLGCRPSATAAHRRLRQRRRHPQGSATQHFRRILPDRGTGSGPARGTGGSGSPSSNACASC